MFQEIFKYLFILGALILSNILLGIFYNVNIKKFKFNFVKLVNGIIKSFIVVFAFCTLYYSFYQLPQLTEAVGFDPQLIMFSAIIVYVSKVGKDLSKILGLNSEDKEE